MTDRDYQPVAAADADDLHVWLDNAGERGGAPSEMIDAAEDILRERRRQIVEEGWTPEGDDRVFAAGGRLDTVGGPLSLAAAAYCLQESGMPGASRLAWPFDPDQFKPRSHRENLIRAGALIHAELERIARAEARRASSALGEPAGQEQ